MTSSVLMPQLIKKITDLKGGAASLALITGPSWACEHIQSYDAMIKYWMQAGAAASMYAGIASLAVMTFKGVFGKE